MYTDTGKRLINNINAGSLYATAPGVTTWMHGYVDRCGQESLHGAPLLLCQSRPENEHFGYMGYLQARRAVMTLVYRVFPFPRGSLVRGR